MKVEQPPAPFSPVTITLETRGEALALLSLLQKVQDDMQVLELSGPEEGMLGNLLTKIDRFPIRRN